MSDISPSSVMTVRAVENLPGLLVLISGWRTLAVGSLECFKASVRDHLGDRINANMSSAM
jgi:hypothetical protein